MKMVLFENGSSCRQTCYKLTAVRLCGGMGAADERFEAYTLRTLILLDRVGRAFISSPEASAFLRAFNVGNVRRSGNAVYLDYRWLMRVWFCFFSFNN